MDNGRVFRKHWLANLTLPGLPWFGFIVLISIAVLYLLRYSHHALWLLVLVVFPFLKLSRLYLAWLGYSVSATAGSNVLVQRSGLLNVSESLIPLTQFATVTYERPWWASLLHMDVADAIVGAIGGPYVLPSMGDFSDLWVVLQSRGEEVPLKRPSAFAVLPGLLWRSALVLLRRTFTGLFALGSSLASLGRSALDRLARGFSDWASFLSRCLRQAPHRLAPFTDFGFTVDPPPGPSSATARRPDPGPLRRDVSEGGYVYRGVPFSPLNSSYTGFCAFCQQFIMRDKNWTKWRYHARDPSRRYYPNGVSDHIARSYLDRLRQKFILIPGPNGCSGERLSCRIRSIEDIQRLIPDFSEPLDEAA
jgi:hypothetical protein